MNIVANFEHRASSSRGKHEGESSFALCDRLSRTRDTSQRQLPTDHDYAVPTREYQTDQSSLKPAPAAARSVLEKQRQRQKQPHGFAQVDRSLHIRARRSLSEFGNNSLEKCACINQCSALPESRIIGKFAEVSYNAVSGMNQSRVIIDCELVVRWLLLIAAVCPFRGAILYCLYGLKSSGAPKGTLSFFNDICSSFVFGPKILYSTHECTSG